MDYQIVHQIAGRIRIRLPLLAENQEYAEKLQKMVQSLPAITEVRINPLAQSLIVTYKPKFSTLDAMVTALQTAIEQVAPLPETPESPLSSVDRSIDPASPSPAPAPSSPTAPSPTHPSPPPPATPSTILEPLIDPPEVDLQTDPWLSSPAVPPEDTSAVASVSSQPASQNVAENSPRKSSSQRTSKKQRRKK